jgi:uncharacterized protein (TIGR02246 family)
MPGHPMLQDEQCIREVIADWLEATRRGEVERVLALMTDDVLFLLPGQAPMDKDAFARQARAQAQAGAPRLEARSRIQEVRVLGDHAYVRSHLTVIAHPPGDGPSTARAGAVLSIFRKDDGRWRLARDANLLAPIDPP